jgi:hypothetical protein
MASVLVMASFQGREPPRMGFYPASDKHSATKNNRQPRIAIAPRRQAAICEAAQTYCRTPPFSRIASSLASTKLIYLLFFPVVFRED